MDPVMPGQGSNSSIAAGPRVEETAPPCWDEEAVSEADVERSIYHGNPVGPRPNSQFEDVDCGSWKDPPNSNCHASFGDQGTTATIGAFGQLLQFSSFLDVGSSGIFSADHISVEEPCIASSRAQTLQDLSEEPFHFGQSAVLDSPYGLSFPGLTMSAIAQPELQWTLWRWPRHVFSAGSFETFPKLKLTIQWMVHDGIVLQQCFLDNTGEDDIEVDVIFNKSMLIRDLDRFDWNSQFNEELDVDHDYRPGPKGYSWVCVHRLNTETPAEGSPDDIQSQHSNTAGSGDLQAHQDIVDPCVPPSARPADTDPFAYYGVQNPRQEGQNPPSHNSNSSTRSRTEQTRVPEGNSSNQEAERSNSHGISVTASITVDGKPQLFEDMTNPQKWSFIVKGRQMPGRDSRSQARELTTAYQMRVLDDPKSDWKAHIIPLSKMAVTQFLQDEKPAHPLPLRVPYPDNTMPPKSDGGNGATCDETRSLSTETPFGIPGARSPAPQTTETPQSHLGFAARRNLEHILSVCTIPATPNVGESGVVDSLPDELLVADVEAVALTCGDMSGHRICWSASLFALQFLAAIHRILNRFPEEQSALTLGRIKRTCLGHLKWLHLAQQRSSGQRFGANYWVNGTRVENSNSLLGRLPGDDLLDTAFQILKAAACTELCATNDTVAKLRSEWAPSWLDSMEKSDRRKKYAWPHTTDDGVNTFRLDDHVWIWRALKSLEDDDQAWKLMSEKASGSSPAWLSEDDIARLRKSFAPDIFQSEVSKRFTTENDVLQRRMLAVTRSARETRFLLHSRDTALFYNEIPDFTAEDATIRELWMRTIECQIHHDGYQEASWDNPLRYALCILMGSQGLTINNNPPAELVRTATEVLFRSCSPNGLFPGWIDRLNKKPVGITLFSARDMDFYYHASFEIPYILLIRANQVCDTYNDIVTEVSEASRAKPSRDGELDNSHRQGPESRQQIPQTKRQFMSLQGDANQRQGLAHASDAPVSRSTAPYRDGHEVFGDVRRAMKKALPFNSLIDYSNIVKVEDEWLYAYPDFFSRDRPLEKRDYNEALRDLEATAISTASSSGQHAAQTSEIVEMPVIVEFEFLPAATTGIGPRVFDIVDVQSSKLMKGRMKHRDPITLHSDWEHDGYDYQTLWRILSPTRTAQHSKKRLLDFRIATKEAATICFAATENSERLNLLDFFERHSRYEKYVSDQCSMVYNTWETELHLSYFQLVDDSNVSSPGIPASDSKSFPGDGEKQFRRAVASFRFKGDFFDRYWTCHMFQNIRDRRRSTVNLLFSKQNRQRKVLEQKMFAEILVSLIESTEEILTEVKSCLGVESGSFTTSIASTKAYLSWSDRWQEFEPFLQTLDDDLASTQVTVDQWDTREEDRGEEKPRWTRNDERQYRASISEIHREIKYQISKLKHLHASIKSLRERCSNRLVKARDELSFRSGQNIATFTYVTVVFLPLGFTASIFSMSGSPDTALVISMVTASVAALAVTVIALVNAKALAAMAERLSIRFGEFTEDAKGSSVIILQEQPEKKGKWSNNGAGDSAIDARSWYLLFWAGYILVELPARMITAACRSLGWSKDEREDSKGLEGSKDNGPVDDMAEIPYLNAIAKPVSEVNLDSHKQTPTQSGYIKVIAHVGLGLLALPVLLSTWVVQLVCLNTWDVVALLGELIRKGLRHISPSGTDRSISSLMANLTKPPEYLRPMRMAKDHLRSKKDPSLPQASKKSEGATETVFSPKMTTEAFP